MSKIRHIIDEETGEILIAAPAEGHSIRTSKQDSAYRELTDFKGRQHEFSAGDIEHMPEVVKMLTTAQCGYLMLLQCYVSFDSSGLLVNPDKSPMNHRDMRRVLGMTRKHQTFKDFYNACIINGIIVELANSNYAINEKYHFRRNFRNRNVVKLYHTKIKRLYNTTSAANLGLLYRMLPFVHYETNALCANPNEPDPYKIVWLKRDTLARAIGVSPTEFSRRIPALKIDGEFVIGQAKVGNTRKYMLNYKVFYRRNREADDTLKGLFNDKTS